MIADSPSLTASEKRRSFNALEEIACVYDESDET